MNKSAQSEPSAPTKRSTPQAFVMCLLLPCALNYFVYYGFVTNYTQRVFALSGFLAQYDHDIYRYRILGKKMLLLIYHSLQRQNPSRGAGSRTALFLNADNLNLYHSYFLLSTTFFCLTIWMLFLTFQSSRFRMREQEKRLALIVVACLIAITQFVVVPYDTPAYFFLALSLYLMLRPRSILTTTALIATVILATLTRETAALTLSMYATLFLLRKTIHTEVALRPLLGMIVAFVGVYVALRLHFGWHQGIDAGITLMDNLHPGNLVGLVFLVSMLYLLTDLCNAIGKRAVLLFLAFSAPYIIGVVMTGWLFEARLGVPLFIGIVVLYGLTERGALLGID